MLIIVFYNIRIKPVLQLDTLHGVVFLCDKMSMSFVATQVVGPMHGTLLCKAPPPCTTRQGNAPH